MSQGVSKIASGSHVVVKKDYHPEKINDQTNKYHELWESKNVVNFSNRSDSVIFKLLGNADEWNYEVSEHYVKYTFTNKNATQDIHIHHNGIWSLCEELRVSLNGKQIENYTENILKFLGEVITQDEHTETTHDLLGYLSEKFPVGFSAPTDFTLLRDIVVPAMGQISVVSCLSDVTGLMRNMPMDRVNTLELHLRLMSSASSHLNEAVNLNGASLSDLSIIDIDSFLQKHQLSVPRPYPRNLYHMNFNKVRRFDIQDTESFLSTPNKTFSWNLSTAVGNLHNIQRIYFYYTDPTDAEAHRRYDSAEIDHILMTINGQRYSEKQWDAQQIDRTLVEQSKHNRGSRPLHNRENTEWRQGFPDMWIDFMDIHKYLLPSRHMNKTAKLAGGVDSGKNVEIDVTSSATGFPANSVLSFFVFYQKYIKVDGSGNMYGQVNAE